MRKVLVLSPHLDDAVLSAGQFLAGRHDCDVVTIFAGDPSDLDQLTPYDEKCGFKDARDAMAIRRQEDEEALGLLYANPIHWSFIDNQYNEEQQRVCKDDIHDLIRYQEAIGDPYEFILAPLGLGHPDHEVVADLLNEMLDEIEMPVYVWEDLPLRVIEPELVQPRLNKFDITKRANVGTGPIADKIRALSCYKSQIGTGILDPYVMYVPERFWVLHDGKEKA